MLYSSQVIALVHLAFTSASLLPVRVDPSFSIGLYSSNLQPSHDLVGSTGSASAPTNDNNGFDIQHVELHNPPSTPASPRLANVERPYATDGKVSDSAIAVETSVNEGIIRIDSYTQHKGDGSTGDGWPLKESWTSFSDMFDHNKHFFEESCRLYNQEANSVEETNGIYDAIQSAAEKTLVDRRFILAIILQESGGCVRAPTSNYGVPNRGMMQDHNGTATCNTGDAGGAQNPCPAETIKQMVLDGTGGTDWGDGLAQCINNAGTNDVSAFYRAARIYNSGSIDQSGNLEDGIATHCYASDVANR